MNKYLLFMVIVVEVWAMKHRKVITGMVDCSCEACDERPHKRSC